MRTMVRSYLALLACTVALSASNLADISGKWSFNPSKSKAAAGTSFSGSEVVLVIVQGPTSITVSKTIKTPGGMVDTTSEDYVLDGTERVTTEGTIVTKRTGSGSADGKSLTLVQTISMGSRVFTTEAVYSLSGNGKVLTVQSTETMNSNVGKNVLVYEKQ